MADTDPPFAPSLIVATDGARLQTLTFGDPGGRPVLFLHGGAQTSESFAGLLPHFADCACVLVDSRGHGRSTLGDRQLTYPQLAHDAECVIEAHALDRPLVVGHSDGGITGLHLGARTQAPIGALVTLSAHMDPPQPHLLDTIYAKITAESWRAKFPEGVALYEALNPQADFDAFFAAASAMWRDTGPGNYPGALVAQIACPTLVIAGDGDHLVPRFDTIKLAETVPGAALGVVPGGSHVVHEEQPALVADWIRAFWNRTAR